MKRVAVIVSVVTFILIVRSGNAGVLAIVYQGETPNYDPTSIVYSLTNWIRAGTIWHGYSDTAALPLISFYLVDNGVHIVPTYPPTQTAYHGYFDLNAIYQQFDVCNRIAAGEVDEVWILVDGKWPNGHFYSDREYNEHCKRIQHDHFTFPYHCAISTASHPRFPTT